MIYAFRLDQAPDGWRYIKQRHENGHTAELSEAAQSAFRFATYQEAVQAGEEWAERANGLRADGMTYRERREARAERLRGWATSRDRKSAARLDSAHQRADSIPFGQPILVGHHSERRHRREVARIESDMRAGVEHADKAESMRERAENIERAADHAIYSDDPDAPERLAERIADLEAQRDRIKAYNASARKAAKTGGMGDSSLLDEKQRAYVLDLARVASYQLRPGGGLPPYLLSNLGGNIARLRERLELIEKRTKRAQAAEDAGGVLIQYRGEYARITFSEKPAQEVRDELKAAGFWYSGGSWQGRRDAMPEGVGS